MGLPPFKAEEGEGYGRSVCPEPLGHTRAAMVGTEGIQLRKEKANPKPYPSCD